MWFLRKFQFKLWNAPNPTNTHTRIYAEAFRHVKVRIWSFHTHVCYSLSWISCLLLIFSYIKWTPLFPPVRDFTPFPLPSYKFFNLFYRRAFCWMFVIFVVASVLIPACAPTFSAFRFYCLNLLYLVCTRDILRPDKPFTRILIYECHSTIILLPCCVLGF